MKRMTAAVILIMLLCGCSQERKPIPQLPPPAERVQAPSTYTGTTVEFYYMPTSPTPPTEPTGYTLPDFPDFDEADNPFDENFSDMFTGIIPESGLFAETAGETTVPETSRRAVTTMTSDIPIVTAVPTSAEEPVNTVTASITVAENLLGAETVPAETETTPAVPEMTTNSFPSANTFDINALMPDRADFPEITSFDINKYY